MKNLDVIKQASRIILFASTLVMTTAQAGSSCWTAGMIDGSCLNTSSTKIKKNTVYSSKCWTAGVLNGMCYNKPLSVSTTVKNVSLKSCRASGILNGVCF